jgi:hypothetical protein
MSKRLREYFNQIKKERNKQTNEHKALKKENIVITQMRCSNNIVTLSMEYRTRQYTVLIS